MQGLASTDTTPIVRVPNNDPDLIRLYLDMGAGGVLVPFVNSAEEAEAIVRATRYPPQGRRGFGPLRASHYTQDYDDYLARANDNILVALIVETREAVENIESIMDGARCRRPLLRSF